MPAMWKDEGTHTLWQIRKIIEQHYYSKGLRFRKLQEVTNRKLKQKYGRYL